MDIQNRADKLAFMEVSGSEGTFKRMTGFTELTKSLNPEIYARRYVDEKNTRSDITSYATEFSFSKDVVLNDDVTDTIKNVFDNELIGAQAQINIVVVDLSEEADTVGSFKAKKRTYSIVPESEGGDNALVLDGTFKACGELVHGTATSTDEWQSCTFTETTD